MPRFFHYLILVFLLFSAGCSGDNPPENLIEEDRYIDLLVEFQILQNYQEVLPKDSVAVDSLRSNILQKHGISFEQFKRSHHYYRQQDQAHSERLDEAIERLRMDQLQDTASTDSAALSTQPG